MSDAWAGGGELEVYQTDEQWVMNAQNVAQDTMQQMDDGGWDEPDFTLTHSETAEHSKWWDHFSEMDFNMPDIIMGICAVVGGLTILAFVFRSRVGPILGPVFAWLQHVVGYKPKDPH